MFVTFEKAPSAVIQEKGDKYISNGIPGYPDLGRGSHFQGIRHDSISSSFSVHKPISCLIDHPPFLLF